MKKALIVSTVSRQFTLFERGNIDVLHHLGYEIHCAANYQDANEKLDELDIIRHQFDIKRSPFSFANINAYKQLKRLINDIQPHLIHCHSPMGGVLARLAARNIRKNGTRVIYTAHGFHFYQGSPLINWLIYYPVEKVCSHLTDDIITLNKEDYAFAQKKMKSTRVHYVAGIGVNVAKIINIDADNKSKKSELGISENAKIIISVGELNSNKNHETLLRAYARMANKDNIYVVLCGKGELSKKLKNLSVRLGISDKIIFAGYRNDVVELLKISNCFVFPSFREGLPVAIMEAMASGLPIICSKIRGNVDLINNDEGGFLLEPTDIDGFAKAMEQLLHNDYLCKQMGSANLVNVQQYDVKRVTSNMNKIYECF